MGSWACTHFPLPPIKPVLTYGEQARAVPATIMLCEKQSFAVAAPVFFLASTNPDASARFRPRPHHSSLIQAPTAPAHAWPPAPVLPRRPREAPRLPCTPAAATRSGGMGGAAAAAAPCGLAARSAWVGMPGGPQPASQPQVRCITCPHPSLHLSCPYRLPYLYPLPSAVHGLHVARLRPSIISFLNPAPSNYFLSAPQLRHPALRPLHRLFQPPCTHMHAHAQSAGLAGCPWLPPTATPPARQPPSAAQPSGACSAPAGGW